MDERKINCFLIVFAIISIPIFYNISENSGILQGKLINSGLTGMLNITPRVVYDLNIRLENHMITRMKTYEAQGIKNTVKDVEFYGNKLDIKNNIEETPLEFIIEDAHKQLTVSKDKGIIQYKNLIKEKREIVTKIGREEAIKRVMYFIEDLNLTCNHQKSIVEEVPDKKIFKVRFINTLEGILNYSYCTKADVSYSGEILYLECHQLIYQPREIVPIKSIKEAYEELTKIPIDGENITIDIQKAELVYILETNNKKFIVKPAYRFFGEINKESTFEYFISAVDR